MKWSSETFDDDIHLFLFIPPPEISRVVRRDKTNEEQLTRFLRVVNRRRKKRRIMSSWEWLAIVDIMMSACTVYGDVTRQGRREDKEKARKQVVFGMCKATREV